jgi:uncharacterized protein (TIGR02594 family)
MRNDIINPAAFGSDPRYFTGLVEDRADPMSRGRVRVRVFGIHSPDILKEDLPWAMVLLPVTSASIGGVGVSPVGLMEGSMVLVSFLDGADRQMPLVHGSLTLFEAASTGRDGAAVSPDGVLDVDSAYNGPTNVSFVGEGPKWLQIARGEVGVKEVSGGGNNARVLEYAKTNGFSDDETAWCASFAKWCLQQAGISTSGVTGKARSFETASSFERLDEPLLGAVYTKWRESPSSGKGHIGFLNSIQGGQFGIIGGNQSDQVKESFYSKAGFTGFWWPKGHPKDPYKMNGSSSSGGSAPPATGDNETVT